jgi:hypothetical protein
MDVSLERLTYDVALQSPVNLRLRPLRKMPLAYSGQQWQTLRENRQIRGSRFFGEDAQEG